MSEQRTIKADDGFQASIAATRKTKGSLYHVRHITGATMDLCTSEQAARSYLKNGCRGTHLLDVFRINAAGEQHLLHAHPCVGGGFLMADLAKVVYGRARE